MLTCITSYRLLDYLYWRDYGAMDELDMAAMGYDPDSIVYLHSLGFIRTANENNKIMFPFSLSDFTITFQGLWVRFIAPHSPITRYYPDEKPWNP